MATLCFCPPDNWSGFALMKGAIPTSLRCVIALSKASSLERCKTFLVQSMQFCRTVMLLKRLNDWNTIPTFALYSLTSRCTSLTSLPRKYITPVVCFSSLLIHLSNVDLPDPEDPTIQIISPSLTSMSIFLRTSCLPKDLLRSFMLITVSPIRCLLTDCPYIRQPVHNPFFL